MLSWNADPICLTEVKAEKFQDVQRRQVDIAEFVQHSHLFSLFLIFLFKSHKKLSQSEKLELKTWLENSPYLSYSHQPITV